MNECKTSLFANPRNTGGRVSAARCGAFLARLRRAEGGRPDDLRLGPRLSPRATRAEGRLEPARDDTLDWLKFLGQWYRQSGRAAPLMDGIDIHPDPIPQNLPFETGYNDPTSLRRKPAAGLPGVLHGIQGTGQRTVGPGRLPVSLNEAATRRLRTPPSRGSTPAPRTARACREGRRGYQAAWYAKLVDFALCDADITKVNIFKLVDETALEGWQSGPSTRATWRSCGGGVQGGAREDGGPVPSGPGLVLRPVGRSCDEARTGEEGGRQEDGCKRKRSRRRRSPRKRGPRLEEGPQEGRQAEAAPEVRLRAARGQTRRQRSS